MIKLFGTYEVINAKLLNSHKEISNSMINLEVIEESGILYDVWYDSNFNYYAVVL